MGLENPSQSTSDYVSGWRLFLSTPLTVPLFSQPPPPQPHADVGDVVFFINRLFKCQWGGTTSTLFIATITSGN